MTSRLGPASRATLLVVVLLVAFAGGATAKGKYDAKLAKNSDKVDGKHAVSATASPERRKGRLVATHPQTGLLPSDIVGTVARAVQADTATEATHAATATQATRATDADDAAALGGVSAETLRVFTLSITSAGAAGTGANVFADQAQLNHSQDGTLSWTLLLPPDHVPADDVFVDLLYAEDSPSACSWYAFTGGILEGDGGSFVNSAWVLPSGSGSSGPVSVPAGQGDAQRATFTLATGDRQPGSLVTFTLTRQPANPVDNCLEIGFRGIQFRY